MYGSRSHYHHLKLIYSTVTLVPTGKNPSKPQILPFQLISQVDFFYYFNGPSYFFLKLLFFSNTVTPAQAIMVVAQVMEPHLTESIVATGSKIPKVMVRSRNTAWEWTLNFEPLLPDVNNELMSMLWSNKDPTLCVCVLPHSKFL